MTIYEETLTAAKQHIDHIYEIEQRRGIYTSNADYLEAVIWLFDGRIEKNFVEQFRIDLAAHIEKITK